MSTHHRPTVGGRRARAFTLVEILIVVIILGILATIIIGAFANSTIEAGRNSLKSDLRAMRSALELYIAEHGTYPSGTTVEQQLTQYTDASGATSATRTGTHTFGPYVLQLPPLPVGVEKGKSGITSLTYTAGFGWGYDPATGTLRANLPATEVDDRGVPYNTY